MTKRTAKQGHDYGVIDAEASPAFTLVASINDDFTPGAIASLVAMKGRQKHLVMHAERRVKYESEGDYRKAALETFLDSPAEYTHLLYLDTDVLVEPDTLQQLLAADVPAICAWFQGPEPFFNPLHCTRGEVVRKYPAGRGVQRIALGCLACTLITRDTAEQLRGWPWVNLNGNDTHFWHRLEALGIPAYVHTDVVLEMEPRA